MKIEKLDVELLKSLNFLNKAVTKEEILASYYTFVNLLSIYELKTNDSKYLDYLAAIFYKNKDIARVIDCSKIRENNFNAAVGFKRNTDVMNGFLLDLMREFYVYDEKFTNLKLKNDKSLTKEESIDIIKSFLNSTDKDAYKKFLKVLDEDNLLFLDLKEREETGFMSNNYLNNTINIVIDENLPSLLELTTISYEVGHIMNKTNTIEDIDRISASIYSEVKPKIYENELLRYLAKNNVLKEDIKNMEKIMLQQTYISIQETLLLSCFKKDNLDYLIRYPLKDLLNIGNDMTLGKEINTTGLELEEDYKEINSLFKSLWGDLIATSYLDGNIFTKNKIKQEYETNKDASLDLNSINKLISFNPAKVYKKKLTKVIK